MPDTAAPGWTAWIAPAIVVAVVSTGVIFLNNRFATVEERVATIDRRLQAADEKMDRRFEAVEKRVAETNTRIDQIISNIATISVQQGKTDTEIGYIRNRLDKVADKLQVAAADTP
jgi:uncharacterized coiled-coil protein SlyX